MTDSISDNDSNLIFEKSYIHVENLSDNTGSYLLLEDGVIGTTSKAFHLKPLFPTRINPSILTDFLNINNEEIAVKFVSLHGFVFQDPRYTDRESAKTIVSLSNYLNYFIKSANEIGRLCHLGKMSPDEADASLFGRLSFYRSEINPRLALSMPFKTGLRFGKRNWQRESLVMTLGDHLKELAMDKITNTRRCKNLECTNIWDARESSNVEWCPQRDTASDNSCRGYVNKMKVKLKDAKV